MQSFRCTLIVVRGNTFFHICYFVGAQFKCMVLSEAHQQHGTHTHTHHLCDAQVIEPMSVAFFSQTIRTML